MNPLPASSIGPMPAPSGLPSAGSAAVASPPSLGPGIHAAILEGGIVFLDLARDEYACVAVEAGSLDALPSSVIAELVDAGILTCDRALGRRHSPLQAPDWIDHVSANVPLRTRDVVRFIRALMSAGLRFRRRRVADLIDLAGTLAIASHALEPAAQVALRFERLVLLLPFRFQCLFRSYLLAHMLAQYGHRADWIFGVGLFPFRAHCWLAQGHVLVGEDAYRLTDYVPILIASAHSQ